MSPPTWTGTRSMTTSASKLTNLRRAVPWRFSGPGFAFPFCPPTFRGDGRRIARTSSSKTYRMPAIRLSCSDLTFHASQAFSALLLAAVSPALAPGAAAASPPDYRFKVETLFESIAQPMEIELAPDGRLFFNEYKGTLKIYNPATK